MNISVIFHGAKTWFLILLIFSINNAFPQKAKVDSLHNLLITEKVDSNKVQLLWRMASAASVFNPDTAFILSYESISLAKDINYLEGQSRATGIMANIYMRIGNYPKALELNIEKLKLEENRNVPLNYASVLINIGIVYALQEEYNKALIYYNKADSLIELHNLESIAYNSALNTGDTYDRLNQSEKAFTYFKKSLELAKIKDDGDLKGTSLTGMGHSYRKMKNYAEATSTYKEAIEYLQKADDNEMLCETTLGLAKLYRETGKIDSARHYANLSMTIAKTGFPTKEMEAALFLSNHYKQNNKFDSAFSYMDYSRQLNDSINSKNSIRKSQLISSNEQIRQLEIAALQKKEKQERNNQLQLLLIAVCIPMLFLVTLLLSKISLSIKAIRILGVLSLLFFFEYLTLLIHPTVAKLTHHTPIYEIFILVAVGAFIIPFHHKIEHWLIHKLLHRHPKNVTKLKETNDKA